MVCAGRKVGPLGLRRAQTKKKFGDKRTAHDANEHMVWCEATVKKLRELSEEEALSWWENDCQKPDWLEIQPEDGESIDSFADRLEQEEFEWAETASVRNAEEI